MHTYCGYVNRTKEIYDKNMLHEFIQDLEYSSFFQFQIDYIPHAIYSFVWPQFHGIVLGLYYLKKE